jgi:ferric-dicitrate binding protein FerR (iron transport regulator)
MSDMENELFQLAQKVQTDQLTPDEAARLEEWLRTSQHARTVWFEIQDLELGLHELCASNNENPPAVLWMKTESTRSFRAWIPLALACSLFGVLLGGWYLFDLNSRVNQRREVASLLLMSDCKWDGDRTFRESERLMPGTIGLREGTTMIRWDGGADVVLDGKCKVEIVSAGEVRLIAGKIVARVPESATGFRVTTPSKNIIDLGTEFSVSIDDDGTTDLHVLDGVVEWSEDNSSAQHRLHQGEGVRFEPNSRNSIPLSESPEGFESLVTKAWTGGKAEEATVSESFNYPIGDLSLDAASHGQGWIGHWRTRTKEEFRPPENTSRSMGQIESLEKSALSVHGDGKAIRLAAGSGIFVRDLAEAIDMSAEGVNYVSLIAFEPLPQPRPGLGPLDEGIRLTLRNSKDFFGKHVSFGITQHQFPCIRTQMGVGVAAYSPVPFDKFSLWVGKIVSRHGGEDEIFFQVFGENEHVGMTEPRTWQVSTRGVFQDGKLDRLLLSSHGHAPRIVDEIRIGPTWRSVVSLPLASPLRKSEN